MKRAATTSLEIVILLVASTALGLGVNAVRSDRLILSKNYFRLPLPDPEPAPDPATGTPVNTDAIADPDTETDQPDGSVREHGFQTVTFDEAFETFHDPKFEAGMYIFVDARDDDGFMDGHIPGAYQLDHYRAEQYLPDLLPVAMGADRVIVYCNGGDCEDSIFASGDLLEQGVPRESLFLYEGGMKEWRSKGGPVDSREE
ncbi:MAG: rhodanese-like domain-containing protein [Planctomycetota bacterium]